MEKLIKLYYVVEKQLENIDNIEEATGWKTIIVYKIEGEELHKIIDIEVANSTNSEEEILDNLDSDEYGDVIVKLISL